MTRSEGLLALHRLARGLGATDAGVWRLRERLATHDEAEALRDLLIEMGAKALLEEDGGGTGERR